MSHNLYLKRVPSESDCKRMHSLVDSGRFDTLEDFVHLCTQTLHFGKFSCGWKFKIDLNGGEYYQPTREGIIRFCEENGYVVIGERDVLTIREAFELIDDWNAKASNKYSAKIYFQEHPEYYDDWMLDKNAIKKYTDLGYDVQYGEFENDGLNFSVDTDWE